MPPNNQSLTGPPPGSQWREMLQPERLSTALVEATEDKAWMNFDAKLIAGGKSNLTFQLTSSAGDLVLRRPPSGGLFAGAHDMGREVRVQRALANEIAVPKIILHRANNDVLGVPFYVMTKVDGWVIRDRLPDSYASDQIGKRSIADALLDQLAHLHSIDVVSVGLEGFGRPVGFLERQVRRWARQASVSRGSTNLVGLERLSSALLESIPAPSGSAIVHGDFRLDNCMLDRTNPGKVAAVLDWELSTLGDPLTDLALWLLYWPLPGETEVPLVPSVTSLGGFPDRSYLLDGYASRTGRDLDVLPFHEAFARLKFAAIIQGVTDRSASGSMGGQAFQNVDAEIARLLDEGLTILDEWKV